MHVFTYIPPKYQAMMNATSNYGLEEAGMAQIDDSVGCGSSAEAAGSCALDMPQRIKINALQHPQLDGETLHASDSYARRRSIFSGELVANFIWKLDWARFV
jgi:hypothetical protein